MSTGEITVNEKDDCFVIVIPKSLTSKENIATAVDYLRKNSRKAANGAASTRAGKFKKILVVDDFALARNLITQMLVEELKICAASAVVHAKNGKEAIAKLLNDREFDFIISDWNMPEMNGYELLTAVRGNASLKTLPFLMITAEGEVKNVKMALQAGVSGYILKPFTAEKLKEKLQQMQLI